MCGTNSIDPIFFKEWIELGCISSIKKPEIDPAAVHAADRVALHTHDLTPIIVVAEGAPFQEESKGKAWNAAKELDFSKYPTIADLIVGNGIGRENDKEVTCFLNNLGLRLQFAAAGSVIYKRAIEQGIETNCPPTGSPKPSIRDPIVVHAASVGGVPFFTHSEIPMTWIFNNEEIDQVLDMADCITALDAGYRDLAAGIGAATGTRRNRFPLARTAQSMP